MNDRRAVGKQATGTPGDQRPSVSSRGVVRRIRLWSGLVLFSYTIMHFMNHAFGIRSVDAMRDAAPYLLHPWQSGPGLVLLYGALLSHLALGLYALYRRRHLRIPTTEVAQLVLGLAIPLLLISHAAAVRIGESAYGLEIGYLRVIYQYWIVSPDYGLPRQFLLLLVVWIHGCIGIRNWLRTMSWYPQAVPALASLATLLPVLAALGFLNAGLDMRAMDLATLPAYVKDVPGTVQAENFARIYRVVDLLTLTYIGIVAGVFLLRLARNWHSQRFRAVRLTYPGDRTITVPLGFSVLEASRWAGIAHASVCGGRGRCSTCRVDVVAGGETLLPPTPEEQALLDRIGAPPSVRLACQIRPTQDVSVVPLVHPARQVLALDAGLAQQVGRRQEADVAALFVDLRQSTRLSDDRLPYDALFIVERFINTVSAAVRNCGGHVTNVAGDGVMSVFSIGGSAAASARGAFDAALQLWDGIDALSHELGGELTEPLRFGIGLHVGVAVIGIRWQGGLEGMPFLGDTGNVAARLEGETKRMNCTMVASKEAVRLVSGPHGPADFATVAIAGKVEPLEVACFRSGDELRSLLGESTPA